LLCDLDFDHFMNSMGLTGIRFWGTFPKCLHYFRLDDKL